MDNYVDRGIIKWLPFDGLVGFHDLIKDLKYRLGKKDKPQLSEDQLTEMDYTLKTAIRDQIEVHITYYEDGYLKESIGLIKKVDEINRELILLSASKYKLDDILNLELIT